MYLVCTTGNGINVRSIRILSSDEALVSYLEILRQEALQRNTFYRQTQPENRYLLIEQDRLQTLSGFVRESSFRFYSMTVDSNLVPENISCKRMAELLERR